MGGGERQEAGWGVVAAFALLKQESSRCQQRTHLRLQRPGSARHQLVARLDSFPGQVGKAASLAREAGEKMGPRH